MTEEIVTNADNNSSVNSDMQEFNADKDKTETKGLKCYDPDSPTEIKNNRKNTTVGSLNENIKNTKYKYNRTFKSNPQEILINFFNYIDVFYQVIVTKNNIISIIENQTLNDYNEYKIESVLKSALSFDLSIDITDAFENIRINPHKYIFSYFCEETSNALKFYLENIRSCSNLKV
ncbi:MAG: hypothetical protein GW803_01820, partial [Caldiserica bacterium]|nr:hypothetical protein [Caldisericota bacterium]